MSRGLGSLQRQILETLDAARAAAPKYPGSGYGQCGLAATARTSAETPLAAGWIWVGHSCVKLAPDVYDMRCSITYLARRAGKLSHMHRPTDTFCAAFSRALHGLVARGCLQPLWLVPLEGWDPDFTREQDLTWCADGTYFT